MAAAPFKAILKFRAEDGTSWTTPATVSDVNAAYYIFPDGNSDYMLPSNHGNIYLVDLILSAAGTDTTTADIFCNGRSTGERIMNGLNVTTVIGRQFEGAHAIGFAPGARIKFVQNT